MHNTCVTIRTRWSVPYSSTDYTICSNERYPFAYSSSRTTPCCCSCCSSSNYRAPLIPNYCYGYGQSSLIQRPPCRNVCLGGYDRLYYPRLPVCDVDRRCCVDKAVNFRGKCVGGRRRRGLRKVVVFEDIDGSYDLGDVDEADILLSLLADDTDEDCLYVKRKSKRLVKKPMVEKRENGGSCRECGSKKKKVDLGVFENDDSREYESVVPSSRNRRRVEITQMKEDGEALARKESRKTRINEEKRDAILGKENQRSKGKQEQESLLRNENWKARAREEEEEALVRKENRKTKISEEKREATLRKANQRSEEMQEQESLLRKENWKARAREEEREEFFRREEHRPKVTRAGSNCSSYYSVASTAGYESDDDIVLRDERYAGESSSGYKDNSRSNEIVYHEAVEEDRRHEVDRVGHEVSLARNRTAQESHTSSSVMESDFRKKSEKKLTDVSVEEIESRIGIRQKESDHSVAHGSGFGKSSNSYMNVDDTKFISTGSASVDIAKHLHSQSGEEVLRQSETGMKYKQLVEIPDDDRRDMKTSYGSKKMYSGKDSMSAKEISSSQIAGKKHQTIVGLTIRDDESKKNLQEVSEVSNTVDVDVRRTAVLQKKFEISDKKREDYSTNVLSSVFDAKKKQRHDKVTEQYQQLTKKESTSVSEKQSDTKLVKQEENVNLVYGSSQRSEDRYSQSHSNHTRREDSRNESMKLTNISITQSGHSSEIVVDEQNKTNLETLVGPPYSHSGAKGAHHDESTSASTIATVNNESLQTSKLHEHHLERSRAMHQEEYGVGQINAGQTLMLTAHEDALGSAARFQKSSAQYVGEFVDQVRHETMSSETQREKKTNESQLLHEEKNDQRRLSQYSSGDSSSKEQDVRHASQVSGVKGPSDEVWKVDEPPVQETSGDEKNTGNVIAKRTGRSLWNVMADVFRLRWSSQSESHSASGKKSGRSSPNQSTSSETWFSGHEAEENKENTEEKEKKSVGQEQKIHSQFKESSSSSTSEGHLEQVGINAPSTSEIMESGLHSSEETSGSNLVGTSNTAPIPRHALRLQRSPVVRSALETGDENASGSSMSEQLNNESLEQSELVVTQGGRKGRILQRKDQMIKDNFDEWEEAVRLETEQRKMDEMFMREALVEARKAAESWEVPVGAVLVHKGKIIARGWNLVEETRDSTAHAEMICIREASKILRTWRLSDTTLYVTLEPCPMCAGAVLQARVDCVVWGAPNKLLGADGSWIRLFPSGDGGNALEQTDKPAAPVHPFHPKITIRRNVLASECADAMQQFFQLRRKKKDKRSESPSPPSCLPIPHHQPKFLTKFQGALNILFTS